MAAHNDWIKQGFIDGTFLVVGSIESDRGGSIIAHNILLEDLQQRVSSDPFVSANVVSAEVIEIAPRKTDERLDWKAQRLRHMARPAR